MEYMLRYRVNYKYIYVNLKKNFMYVAHIKFIQDMYDGATTSFKTLGGAYFPIKNWIAPGFGF